MIKKIKVSEKIYTSPNAAVKTENGWEPAKPELWEGFGGLKGFMHLFGNHYSYGQPYCIFCGKEEVTLNS